MLLVLTRYYGLYIVQNMPQNLKVRRIRTLCIAYYCDVNTLYKLILWYSHDLVPWWWSSEWRARL